MLFLVTVLLPIKKPFLPKETLSDIIVLSISTFVYIDCTFRIAKFKFFNISKYQLYTHLVMYNNKKLCYFLALRFSCGFLIFFQFLLIFFWYILESVSSIFSFYILFFIRYFSTFISCLLLQSFSLSLIIFCCFLCHFFDDNDLIFFLDITMFYIFT